MSNGMVIDASCEPLLVWDFKKKVVI